MTIQEIRVKYPNNWIIVEYSKLGEDLEILEGEVIAKSPSRDAIYQQLLTCKGKDVAIEYTGKLPDDYAVVF